MSNHKNEFNNKNLFKAIENTFNRRGTKFDINRFKETIELLEDSTILKNIYIEYQRKLEYTKQVKFEQTIKSLKEIANILEDNFVMS